MARAFRGNIATLKHTYDDTSKSVKNVIFNGRGVGATLQFKFFSNIYSLTSIEIYN